jgi:hypothetical protein
MKGKKKHKKLISGSNLKIELHREGESRGIIDGAEYGEVFQLLY